MYPDQVADLAAIANAKDTTGGEMVREELERVIERGAHLLDYVPVTVKLKKEKKP